VSATSAGSAWAVGSTGKRSLALHWNGHAWTRVSAPGSDLAAVAASSPGNAWAVGRAGSGQLIAHWNGRSWKRTPAPLAKADLLSVATTSPSNAWVVGELATSPVRTLILHWNGHGWKRVASPNPHPARNTGDLLEGMTALSARNAWAVGAVSSDFVGPLHGLILHWNGHSWAHQRTPVQRRFGAALSAVSASSRRSAFAVGSYCKSACLSGHPFYLGLILRWTGTAWKIAATPAKRNTSPIAASVTSASNAWAVGNSPDGKVLILHWNGRSWRT
jgi:hypothetical protein